MLPAPRLYLSLFHLAQNKPKKQVNRRQEKQGMKSRRSKRKETKRRSALPSMKKQLKLQKATKHKFRNNLKKQFEEEEIEERIQTESQEQDDTTLVKAPVTGKRKAVGELGSSFRETRSRQKQEMDELGKHVTTPTNKKEERKKKVEEQVKKSAENWKGKTPKKESVSQEDKAARIVYKN